MKGLVYLFLLFTTATTAQDLPALYFESFSAIEQNAAQEAIEGLTAIDSLNQSNYFFTKKYGSQEGFYFVKKEKKGWKVYDLQEVFRLGGNTTLKCIKQLNKQYLGIETVRFASGACSNTIGTLFLFDVETPRSHAIVIRHETLCFDEAGDPEIGSKCVMTYQYVNQELIVKPNAANDFGQTCIQGRRIRLDAKTPVHTHFYHRASKKFFPLTCKHSFCTGISVQEFRDQFPQATFKTASNWTYGFDSQDLGLEVYMNGKLVAFAALIQQRVVGQSIISPDYKFDEICVGTSIQDVLAKHPKAELYVDLITGAEYMYLESDKILLIFNTASNHRVGAYPNDPEDPAQSILRPEAKVERIQF